MHNSKRNIEDLFNAAKNEPAGFSADEAQTIVNGADVLRHNRKPIMILTLALSSVIMAMAMLIGDRSASGPTQGKTTPLSTSSTMVEPSNQPVNETQRPLPSHSPSTDEVGIVDAHSDEQPQIPSPFVTVYNPGIDVNNLPGVDNEFVQAALANGNGADSIVVTVKSVNSEETTQVTVYSNGDARSFNYTKDVSHIPYMITTKSGKGCRVSANEGTGLEPNQMLPVAANLNNTDVLLWYPATLDVVRGFPDSLQAEIESSLKMEGMKFERRVVKMNSSTPAALCLDSSRMQVQTKVIVIDDGVELSEMDVPRDNELDKFRTEIIELHSKSDVKDFANLEPDIDIEETVVSDQPSEHIKRVWRKRSDAHPVDSVEKWTKSLYRNDWEYADRDNSKQPTCSVAQTRLVIIKSRVKAGTKQLQPINSAPSLQEFRTSSASVTDSKVFPNPTWEKGATLDYTLSKPTSVSVNVISLDGKIAQTIVNATEQSAGNHQLPFVLKDVQPGMYMVVLTTQSGEQVVQRLIVN